MSRIFWLYALPGVLTFFGAILNWLSLQGLPRVIPQKGEIFSPLWKHVLLGLGVGVIPVLNWVGVYSLIVYIAERFQAWWQKRRLRAEVQERLQVTRDALFNQAMEEEAALRKQNAELFKNSSPASKRRAS